MNKRVHEFETYNVIDDRIEVINSKRFELWMLCSTAVSFLAKTEDDANLVKEGGVPDFMGYAQYAFGNITNLAATEDKDTQPLVLRPAVDKVKKAIYAGEDAMSRFPAKRKIGDFDKEFWWFYSEAVAALVDSFKIVTDEHKTKKKAGKLVYEHKTRIIIENGDDKWALSVTIKDGVERIKSFHNGHENIRTGKNSKPYVNEQAERVDFVLQKIAQSVAVDQAFNYFAILASNDVETVKKAHQIAKVLNGNYKFYLLTAQYFKEAINSIVKATTLSKDEAIAHFLDTKLRLEGDEKKIMTAMFNRWLSE